jgi:hypothetical protein
MDIVSHLALGFDTVFQPVNLLFCFIGVFLGTAIGVLPGLGGIAGMSLLIPFIYGMDPVSALAMLMGMAAEGAPSTGAMLFGRRTYEDFYSFWPHQADNPFTDVLNRTPKYVASRTLDTLEWANSQLLEGDISEAVARLKETDGPELQRGDTCGDVEPLLGLDAQRLQHNRLGRAADQRVGEMLQLIVATREYQFA